MSDDIFGYWRDLNSLLGEGKDSPLKEQEIFSIKTEKMLHNLKETSPMYCFLCLFLLKVSFFGFLKIKVLCIVMQHMKHSGPESCIIDMSLLFVLLLDPELSKLSM